MAYVSVADLQTYLGIPSTTTDDEELLGDMITAAQKAVDTFCGRTFEGSASARTFDAERDVCGRTLTLDKDLCSITSITNGDGATVSASSYVTEPRNDAPYYAITLKQSATVQWAWSTTPENAISINGVWAYSATAPADIVQACKRLAAFLYRQKASQGIDDRPLSTPGGVVVLPNNLPRDVQQLLYPYRRRSL